MTTPKPGRGPDTQAGRIELLARLQLAKSEVDAILGDAPSACIGVLWVEVHGALPERVGAFVLRGTSLSSLPAIFGLPAADRRLGAASELFSIAFLLLAYADFSERGWLRQVLDGGVIWQGGDTGVEAFHACEIVGLELQDFLRKAILAVCRSAVAPTNRRDHKNEQAVKDLLRKMADELKRSSSTKPAKPLYEDRKLTRSQFGIPASRRGVKAGDPPRVLKESVVRSALESAVKRGLLKRSGTSSDRRYWFTKTGWDFVHSTIQVARLAGILAQASVEVSTTNTQVSFHCAILGETVIFTR